MIESIFDGLKNGFIDSKTIALDEYKPRLLINDIDYGKKVLTSLCEELRKCDSFFFSVAFLTESGVAVLLSTLKELSDKGIKGKIIVSQYQNFTQPKALKRLLKFKNIDLYIITEDAGKMHSKGYIFKKDQEYTFIVGSSNLTQDALCKNKEWNIKLNASKEGRLIQDVLNEFEYMLSISTKVTTEWIEKYNEIYKEQRQSLIPVEAKSEQYITVNPNKMQVGALDQIKQLRSLGANKALIVSATGTGKTYLSAFDVKIFNPKKFLFIVHREKIANDAMKSYKRVIGDIKNMKLLGGGHKDIEDADYIFAMISTLTKDEVLKQFKREEFDYIVIDEVHRAGADSYQKVFNYFKPKFWLGMSATPERTDGYNIFEMFDYNLAYEIRLQEAMKEDLICPFHYYGVSEIQVNGKTLGDEEDFYSLVSEERVKNILEKISEYGFCGDRVKGLVFCRNISEAEELSKKFNEFGYRTVALSGKDDQLKRDEAIERLEQEENNSNALDYIFTVDIFNEGVDIPAINQVVLLRPTESAIVFVQQLGRGLRKNKNKDYVVVLDFIGNYDNNYMIPIALSGDKTYNKDNLRKYLVNGIDCIPGCSTISFEKIVKERIFEKIDTVKFKNSKIFKDAYTQLKGRLGRVPTLMDFDENGSIDVINIFEHQSYRSYYNFLKSIKEKDYTIELNDSEAKYIEFISKTWAAGKRPHELEFLNLLINSKDSYEDSFKKLMKEKYSNIKFTKNTMECIRKQFDKSYFTGSYAKTYKDVVFIENKKQIELTEEFKKNLLNSDFKKMVQELIDFGLSRNKRNYGKRYEDTSFQLYQKYTYEDVCRNLDWAQNQVALNIGGYKYDKDTNTYPVFINYKKADNVQASIKYEDEFISNKLLKAISKNGRTKDSPDVIVALDSKNNNTEMDLFVRKDKNDEESKQFYYLGKITPTGEIKEITMAQNKNAVEIYYELNDPLEDNLYKYITG